MELKAIEFDHFKAPGKSMFAHVPEKDWKHNYSRKEDDCIWSLRSLFVKEGNTSLLIDIGFGNMDAEALDEYKVDEVSSISDTLKQNNILEVSDLLFTHLHLDHCGGILHKTGVDTKKYFESSRIIVNAEQLQAALNPSLAEASSFQKEVVNTISKHNNLLLIEKECFLFPWLELFIFHGHTQGLTIPVIHSPQASIAFVGDLIPSAAHLLLQCTMEYDYNQMLTLAERQEFLEEAYENEYVLFFQHDFYHECCSLKKEKGKIVPNKYFMLEEVS